MRRLAPILILGLLAGPSLLATTSVRSNVRLAPGGVWCPTGLSFDELRPGFQSSQPDVFDAGALETSFRSPANGWVYVTLEAKDDVWIDNVLAMRRELFFPGVAETFDSDTCHRSGDAQYPKVRVHALDPEALPWGTFLQQFGMTDPGALIEQGWELGDASLDPTDSAVELLAAGDQAAISMDCAGAGPECPLGTGSLFLPAGTLVRFPMGLAASVDYTLQIWTKGPAGSRLDVRADPFSSCPGPPEGIFIEHTSVLEVEILAAELDEGIDPNLFFGLIEDGSDTYGTVKINGVSHHIPQIDNDDRPSWDGRARFAAFDVENPEAIQVHIELWDNDEFDDAHVDIDPDPHPDRDLDLIVDLCRMRVEGDLSAELAGTLISMGHEDSGADQGLVRFRISTPTGRPLSTDDLAVVDVDFVQAVHRTRYAVTEKPGVVMVSLANNFATNISTEVLVEVYGGGTFISERFPVTLPPEATKTLYLFADTPIYPPSPAPGGGPSFLGINVHVDPDGVYSAGLEPGDCRADNDVVVEKMWKIVETDDIHLTWCKVGRVLDLSNLVSDAKYEDVKTLGTDFIRAIYPTASVTSGDCAIPMPITPTGFALDFIATVLDTFEIPFSSVMPFALVWDMNTFAVLAGMDKVMGVLPYAAWYEQFEGWESIVGNSLGEAAPHAVIFLPEVDVDGTHHVKVTLPAHELAHTYGLSADTRLKSTETCGVHDPFGFGALVCGATGGLDEYKAPDPARRFGNPAAGFWVQLGSEDSRFAPFVGTRQCDRHCFMGSAGANQLADWGGQGRWIDVTDWEFLIERLNGNPDPEILFVGGMADAADNVFLAPWFRLPAGFPDRVEGDGGGYQVRTYDENGDLLQEIGFPATFGAADTPGPTPPINFFGFTIPWNPETARIDIDRSGHGENGEIPAATIATRSVSASVPLVELLLPASGPIVPSSGTLDLQWDASDADGDLLSSVVRASVDGGDNWYVVHGWVEEGQSVAQIPVEAFPPGEYLLQVMVTDGVHAGWSEPIEVESLGPGWLFADGFESGSTSAWN
jgi:hypothetical protein